MTYFYFFSFINRNEKATHTHPPRPNNPDHWDLACFLCCTQAPIEWERETWKAVMAGRDAGLTEGRNEAEAKGEGKWVQR